MKISGSAVAFAFAVSATRLFSQNVVPSETPADAAHASAAPTPAIPGTSQVRIVRLSQVNGEVEMDRKTDRGFEPAMPNLPIVQGARLRTKEGVAEVELEDNSSVRLGSGSVVEFPQLARASSGATLSTMRVLQGTVYVSLAGTKGNEFKLHFGDKDVTLMPSSHIRLSVAEGNTRLAVLDGMAGVEGASGGMSVGKKTTVVYTADAAAPTLVHSTEKYALDEWDKTAVDYHRRSSSLAGGGSGSSYGMNDLSYYGSFADLPGCGSAWRPYFASAAWDPFANGVWAWYPSSGYSWVSPYPWGWTPFHSGEWSQCGNRGWGWRPGGSWNGLQNQTLLMKQKPGTLQPRPPAPPAPGHPTLRVVSTRPITTSGHVNGESFVFRNDSAGLGVPRAAFGRLAGTSATVGQRGSASVPSTAYAPLSARTAIATGGTVPAGHPGSISGMHSGSSVPSANVGSAHPVSSAPSARSAGPAGSSSHR